MRRKTYGMGTSPRPLRNRPQVKGKHLACLCPPAALGASPGTAHDLRGWLGWALPLPMTLCTGANHLKMEIKILLQEAEFLEGSRSDAESHSNVTERRWQLRVPPS